jgi:hypothetical protein
MEPSLQCQELRVDVVYQHLYMLKLMNRIIIVTSQLTTDPAMQEPLNSITSQLLLKVNVMEEEIDIMKYNSSPSQCIRQFNWGNHG